MAVMNFCPSCGSPQEAGANFCVGCGFKLDSINVPPPPSEALGGTNPVASSPIADANYRVAACMEAKGYEIRGDLFSSRAKTVETLTQVVKSLVGIRDEHKQADRILKAGVGSTDMAYEVTRLATGENAVGLVEATMQGAKLAAELVAEVEPAAWAPVIANLASRAYDQAPFLYALFDCVARSGVDIPDVEAPPMRQQLPVQLPPPPAAWQPMVVPMSDPAPAAKKAGSSVGSKVAAVVAITTMGVLGALWLGRNLPTNGINNNVPVHVAAVTVSSMGGIKCTSVLHGGFAFEGNCHSTANLTIAGDLSSQNVLVLMMMPVGEMHGVASVPTGFRGTVAVPIDVQYGSPGCTPNSAYHTAVTVYDAASLQQQRAEQSAPVANVPWDWTWSCS
jgi:hypothetical protein